MLSKCATLAHCPRAVWADFVSLMFGNHPSYVQTSQIDCVEYGVSGLRYLIAAYRVVSYLGRMLRTVVGVGA